MRFYHHEFLSKISPYKELNRGYRLLSHGEETHE